MQFATLWENYLPNSSCTQATALALHVAPHTFSNYQDCQYCKSFPECLIPKCLIPERLIPKCLMPKCLTEC